MGHPCPGTDPKTPARSQGRAPIIPGAALEPNSREVTVTHHHEMLVLAEDELVFILGFKSLFI